MIETNLDKLMKVLMALLCSAGVGIAEVREVATVDEFASAWESARTVDTQIIVRESIDFAGRAFGVNAHCPTSITIRGAKPGVTLKANRWIGDPEVQLPGSWFAFLSFDHDRVTVSDLGICNFDERGAAAKLSNVIDGKVLNCTFSRIGINAYAPRDRTVANFPYNSDGFVFTCPVGGWHGNQSVLVSGCTFTDCAYGNEYAHCVYVLADEVEVRDCTVERSGQPFQCGGKRITYANNTVRHPALVNQRWMRLHVPFVFYLGGEETLISGNRLIGEFEDVCYGPASQPLITGNDYTEAKITGSRPAEN